MSEIVALLKERKNLEYKKQKERNPVRKKEIEKNIKKVEDRLNREISKIATPILNRDSEVIVEEANNIGEYLSRDLSTSQIRNIFSNVKQLGLKENNKNELNLLRPKLAYAAGRHRGGVKDLQTIIDPLIEKVIKAENRSSFKGFSDFFEAILAYHKYHGGKD